MGSVHRIPRTRRTRDPSLLDGLSAPVVRPEFQPENDATLFHGDCREFLRSLPDGCAQLVVTSPPYNIGKAYEARLDLDRYVEEQSAVIDECVRLLAKAGSICWQVGNHVLDGAILPLDVLLYPRFQRHGLKLRNRVVWHFEHGLHCSRRFSGRYEVILWFTRSDDYYFDLDALRVPQKYPGKKYFKGPKAGTYSCNPLGKNPGDVWIIPNVKHNHVEKTIHPCQFPVELIERLVLGMTRPGELVLDPFMGVGSAPAAAVRNRRRAAGAEVSVDYFRVARDRVVQAFHGTLPVRPRQRPVYEPPTNSPLTRRPSGFHLAGGQSG